MSDSPTFLELQCEQIYRPDGESLFGYITKSFFNEYILPTFPNSGGTHALLGGDDMVVTHFSCPCCMDAVVALEWIEPIVYGSLESIDDVTGETITRENVTNEYHFICLNDACRATFRYENRWTHTK